MEAFLEYENEIMIWARRYGEAKIASDALCPLLELDTERVICVWLTAHALNLSGNDSSAEMKALEEASAKPIQLTDGIRDIEHYLRDLNQAEFSSDQILNAWRLQSQIISLATPAQSQAS